MSGENGLGKKLLCGWGTSSSSDSDNSPDKEPTEGQSKSKKSMSVKNGKKSSEADVRNRKTFDLWSDSSQDESSGNQAEICHQCQHNQKNMAKTTEDKATETEPRTDFAPQDDQSQAMVAWPGNESGLLAELSAKKSEGNDNVFEYSESTDTMETTDDTSRLTMRIPLVKKSMKRSKSDFKQRRKKASVMLHEDHDKDKLVPHTQDKR